ncbi:MAG: rhomboid family intramembrane serine protease [Sneathiella sp.]|nr:rhomboid family intramembrane serine protease [Sneathiella sp.]
MENSDEPAFNAPPATMYLVASLIVAHILLTVTSVDTVQWVYEALAFNVGQLTLVLENPSWLGVSAVFLTLNSHLFLHHDFMHLLINAFMLLAFGTMVERTYGIVRYLTMFLICGWVGALSEYIVSASDPATMLYGASGAVFGMMGVTTWILLPKLGMRKVIAFASVMMGLNLVIGLTPLGSMLAGEGATISWAAHLGGFLCGALLPLVLPRRHIWKSQSDHAAV